MTMLELSVLSSANHIFEQESVTEKNISSFSFPMLPFHERDINEIEPFGGLRK
jgi:hypothetical protein